ncbi:MAG: hypothetical protein AAF899_06875 [Pseudomonadota bacterium]
MARRPGDDRLQKDDMQPARQRRDDYAWRNRVILTLVFALALVLGLMRGNLLFLAGGAGGLGWLVLVWRRRQQRG